MDINTVFTRFAPSRSPRQRGGRLLVALSLVLGLGALGGGWPALATTRLPHDPTPSPTAGPRFAIINPLYNNVAEGPVGTNVTVQATTGWTPAANITLSLEVESHPCDPATAIPVSVTGGVTVDPNGAFTATFGWPTAANQSGGATYVICASEAGAGAQVGRSTNVFNVLANQAPTINVSPLTAHAGDMVQVSGTNWLPIAPITLTLQGVGLSFQQDIGETLNASQILPGPDGTFTMSVKLPLDRIADSTASNAQNIVATLGKLGAKSTIYPLFATSQPLNIQQPVASTPVPTITSLPATATPGNQGTGTTNPSSNSEKLLIGLLGLIAVVLLLAGIIVAVLALRGRNAPTDAATNPRRPSGGFGGGYGGYPQDQADATVADGPDWQSRNWNDEDRWQPPGGRPWSGSRANPNYDGRNLPPPIQPSAFDDEDDRYRTRMGDPYQAPPPSRPQGPPPQSRPMGPPPQSRPMPPRPNASRPAPSWNDDPTNQDTGPGPAWPPPRQ